MYSYVFLMSYAGHMETRSSAEVDVYLNAYFAFHVQLVKTLPMNDTIFMAELTPHFFGVGNLKERVQAETTTHDKAAYFLENAIKHSLDAGDITSFQKLLSIMNSGYQTSVAAAIRTRINGKCYMCNQVQPHSYYMVSLICKFTFMSKHSINLSLSV